MGTRARFICAAQIDWIKDQCPGIDRDIEHARVIAGINRKDVSPQLFRALVLTARTPFAVLGCSPYAIPDQVRVASQRMRNHAKRLHVDSFIVMNTIERASALMMERAISSRLGHSAH